MGRRLWVERRTPAPYGEPVSVERGHRAWQVHVDGHLDAAGLAADLA
ncbi:MAG: hypothetical protein JWN29_3672, partial [Acidimicrobiales bacterium]|nr:hypothetical protein [Acidimicrobiales bacterium]